MLRYPTVSDSPPATTERPNWVATQRRGRRLRRDGQKWTRWLHVYSSMIALLVVLFFAVTGLTLNHPEWTFGLDPVAESATGTLPSGSIADDGTVEWLAVSDYLRNQYDVDGEVSDYGTTGSEGYISYRGPGYSADVFFDTDTGSFQLDVEQEGLIAVLNDLHMGRDTTSAWNWLIDASAVFLIVISVTGIVLQLFLSKRRRLALTIAGVGALITLGLILIAVS